MGAADVEAELAKPAWFDTQKAATASFASTSIKAAGAGKFDVAGKLTIKGNARDIVVPVTVAQAGGTSTATGQFTLKRLAFKIGEGDWSDTLDGGRRRHRQVQARPDRPARALSGLRCRPRGRERRPGGAAPDACALPVPVPFHCSPRSDSMTKTLLTAAVLTLAGLAGTAQAQSATYAIDPTHTFVTFEASHFGTSTIRGRFDKKEGTVAYDKTGKTGKADITIDMSSVSTGVGPLDGHLKSKDFFNAAEFPTAKFVGDSFAFDGSKVTEVKGSLTFLGKTQPITLKAARFNCYDNPMLKREVCGGDFETDAGAQPVRQQLRPARHSGQHPPADPDRGRQAVRRSRRDRAARRQWVDDDALPHPPDPTHLTPALAQGLARHPRPRHRNTRPARPCCFWVPPALAAQPVTYRLDPERSFVHAEVLHFNTSTTRIRFGPVEGQVLLDRNGRQGEVGPAHRRRQRQHRLSHLRLAAQGARPARHQPSTPPPGSWPATSASRPMARRARCAANSRCAAWPRA